MKITLVGKIGKTIERQGFTLTIMRHSGPLPSLPKGLPVPEIIPTTTYVIYIGAKQWKRVKEAVQNPDDTVIVEGTQIYDDDYNVIAVFAMNCTTRMIEQTKREAQKAQATQTDED